MIKKIKLKNFMSHKCSELELVDGVNVLTGPNNSGKSAVVSALQLLAELPGREGTYMVRHGENDIEVIVETDEGDEIIWGRTGTPYLSINEKKYTRISKDPEHVLEELHKVLRMPYTKIKDDKINVHFACQKDPIFLLNQPTHAATFFSGSSDAGWLLDVRVLFKDKIVKAKKEKQTYEVSISTHQLEIEKLAPLEEIKNEIDKLGLEFDSIRELSDKIDNGFAILNTLKIDDKKCYYYELKRQLMGQVQTPPEFETTTAIKDSITKVHKLSLEQDRLSCSLEIFNNISPAPVPEDIHALSEVIEDIKRKEAQKNYLYRKNQILEKLAQQPEIEKVDDLKKEVKELKKLSKAQELYYQKWLYIFALKEPPFIENQLMLKDFIKSSKALERQVESLSRELKKAETNLEEWISEHPYCPVCGSTLNTEHITGGHQHG